MTLNITATTLRYICQVSDRRLCLIYPDGKCELYTDQANKSTILFCKDATMVVTYCGIGEYPQNANQADPQKKTTRTDVWLVEALQKTDPSNNPIKKVLKEFTEQSSEWINNLRRNSQINDELFRHTFLFSGWVYPNDPIVFYVSNYEDLKTNQEVLHPWPEFVSTFSHPVPGSTNPCSLHASGDYKSLRNDDIQLLSNVIQKPGAQPRDVINIMVRSIQYAAETSNLISKNCMSALLIPGQRDIICDYHSPSEAFSSYMPNYVGNILMRGIEIYTGDGTPPWHIREALPIGLTKSKVRLGMRNIPANYKTGDALPGNLDPLLERFLQSLPTGITEKEILDAL